MPRRTGKSKHTTGTSSTWYETISMITKRIYLFTGGLTYAYNCQPHRPTELAPFKLVLSRPRTALVLKSDSVNALQRRSDISGRFVWKQSFKRRKLSSTGKKPVSKATKKTPLRRREEKIVPNDWFFLLVKRREKRREERKHRQKLAAVANSPYTINSWAGKTVVI